eukprot:scaffold12.g8286.t1
METATEPQWECRACGVTSTTCWRRVGCADMCDGNLKCLVEETRRKLDAHPGAPDGRTPAIAAHAQQQRSGQHLQPPQWQQHQDNSQGLPHPGCEQPQNPVQAEGHAQNRSACLDQPAESSLVDWQREQSEPELPPTPTETALLPGAGLGSGSGSEAQQADASLHSASDQQRAQRTAAGQPDGQAEAWQQQRWQPAIAAAGTGGSAATPAPGVMALPMPASGHGPPAGSYGACAHVPPHAQQLVPAPLGPAAASLLAAAQPVGFLLHAAPLPGTVLMAVPGAGAWGAAGGVSYSAALPPPMAMSYAYGAPPAADPPGCAPSAGMASPFMVAPAGAWPPTTAHYSYAVPGPYVAAYGQVVAPPRDGAPAAVAAAAGGYPAPWPPPAAGHPRPDQAAAGPATGAPPFASLPTPWPSAAEGPSARQLTDVDELPMVPWDSLREDIDWDILVPA